MKKSGFAAALCLTAALLAGCQAEVQWETVDDTVIEASAPAEEPYVIIFGVPTDADLAPMSEEGRKLYVQEEGDYEILSDVITAPNLDQALRQVSGFGEGEIDVVETRRFGLPAYRFAWASASDEGNYLSQASLVADGNYYYALIFSVHEEEGTAYDDCAEAVFDSFGLYGNELL